MSTGTRKWTGNFGGTIAGTVGCTTKITCSSGGIPEGAVITNAKCSVTLTHDSYSVSNKWQLWWYDVSYKNTKGA